MFQTLLKLMVPLSKYNIFKIKVMFWYFKRKYVMYDLGCPRDYTVDIHVITMVKIRLWLFGITSAMLDLRMLQLLCRLPIKLHS